MNLDMFGFYEQIFTGEAWDDLMSEYQCGSTSRVVIKDGKEEVEETYWNDGQPYTYIQYERMYFRKQARKMFSAANDLLDGVESEEAFARITSKMSFLLEMYSQKLNERFTEVRDHVAKSFDEAKNDILKLLEYKTKTKIFPPIQSQKTIENHSESGQGRPKIKWLGNTNVLITFFYDLLNGQERTGPLIEADKNALKDFLMNNFLDSDGNTLSESTITTLFTPSKTDKRSKIGDRIEISNVKQKK
jgi:hypothetical protein